MNKNVQDKEQKKFSQIEKYLMNYLDELLIHFDIDQQELEILLMNVYNKIRTPNSFKKMVNILKFLRF